jgi:hypothetical protein
MYRKWAMKNTFVSMLPGDIAAHKKANNQPQHTIDSHLVERKLADHVLPYMDQTFKKVAIEWLISTNQVCEFLFDYSFHVNLKCSSLLPYSIILNSKK